MADSVTTSIATEADVDELHEFMLADFLYERSLSAALKVTREQASPCYRAWIESCAPSGVSTIQRNSEGRVVGFNLCSLVRHGEASNEDELESPPAGIPAIIKLMEVLNKNKWALIPEDGERLLYVEVLSVDEKCRGRRGLKLLKLLELSYEKAREMGASGAFAECTSMASQKLFAKTGYQLFREIRLNEFLGEDGKPVFVCPDGTSTAQLVFRKL